MGLEQAAQAAAARAREAANEVAQEVAGTARDAVREVARELSLVRSFLRGLDKGGLWAAMEELGAHLYEVLVPVAEVVGIVILAYIAYALLRSKDLKKHSALVDGRVNASREPPRDIMKPHFFQNRQGLWLHHGLWWDEDKLGTPRGVVVLLHGHSEHSKRFIHVAEHFNAGGFAVFAMDHQGFGRSEGDRGHVEAFEDYVDDVVEYFGIVYRDYPKWRKLPRFLVGHSMGSLISINSAIRMGQLQDDAHKLAGVILSAPAVTIDPARNTWFIRAIGAIVDLIAPKAQLVSFPAYPSTTFLQVKLHATFDPLNYHGAVRVHQGLELVRGTKMAISNAPQFDVPLLILHGTEDMHAAIDGSREFIARISTKDKTLVELIDLRHEPWQEERSIRDPILDAVVAWAVDRLDGAVIKPGPTPSERFGKALGALKTEYKCVRGPDGAVDCVPAE